QEAREIGAAQIELLAEDHAKITGMRIGPMLNALAVFEAVIRIFKRHGDGEILLQFFLVHEVAEKISRCVTEKLGRTQSSKNVLISAAENVGGGCSGGDPGGLVTVRHHGFGFA